ncbi:hypothetical protein SAMD00019534_018100 [Acytostelium subglobosum LB1]|uniref:hypothetical protein n=1 Tax=Acytostelium subglobosum LB1 TaxID=1410327 RepID=UPI0006449922|nr:hypothetical protein SAMD00019534_018100 [Acytostelium subglobosum LB1]GAM18635.1 hypothetical protein SAMD00019534_018100 [Acytostelium subglobosum LB1]|eukprot:XP_012757855.1 hypothetical protein SAMD00019534_018100 [Acytostelium subglobosum LB1]
MADYQGKLFVTVLQAQNLVIKQEKSMAQELAGSLLQGIQKIQAFSSSNVKKLAPIFTAPGGSESTTSATPTTPTVGIMVSAAFEGGHPDDTVFRTTLSGNLTEPKWNESHTFNVINPCATMRFQIILKSETEGQDFLIGTSLMSLIDEAHLWGQKPVAKWINITKKVVASTTDDSSSSSYTDDEIVGRIELQLQYKYRNVWDCVYHGKLLLVENKYEDALEQLTEAVENMPTNPQLYTLIVDCHIGLKNYGKAIENAAKIIQYDHGYTGLLKAARVLMIAGQLEKAQSFIDKAKTKSDNSEEIYNSQMELSHLFEVDNINKLVDQGSADFAKGDYVAAAASFTKAIEINAHSPVLYELRAICYVCAKNNAAAIVDTNKILEIDHNWPKKNNTMSGYMMKDGQINVMAKKRWFGLKSIFMFYYKDINEFNPQGVICLYDFGCAPKPNQKEKFQIKTKDREYYLRVDSNKPQEFDQWIAVLTRLSRTKPKVPSSREIQDDIIWRNIYQKKQGAKTSFMLPEVMMLPETLFVESGRFAFSIGDKIKAKLSSVAQADCTITGWLYKMGAVNKGWQKRYFMIANNQLYYCKIASGEEKQPLITPTGILPLDGAKLDASPSAVAKAHAFIIMTSLRRNFIVAADSDMDKERWLRAIVLASGAPLPVQETDTVVVSSGGVGEEVPTSDSLFSNRNKKIKSLRAVPSADDQLQQQQQQQQQYNNNYNNNNLRRINTNEMSDSESRYFAKFGLNGNTQAHAIAQAAPIIKSNNQSYNNNNISGSQSTLPSMPPTQQQPLPSSSSPHNSYRSIGRPVSSEIHNVLDDDDDDYHNSSSNVGLLSGHTKGINDDVEEGGASKSRRCQCACTIQ